MIRLPTCLVKMYDNVPPLSTISRRISFFLLNDSGEEAAKSTANWQLRNMSEICKVFMTRSNRSNSDLPNFHFAVSAVCFCSFQQFRVPLGGDLGTGVHIVNTHYDRIACWSLRCLTRSSEHLSIRALIRRPFSALLSILPNSASNWTRSERKSV